MTGEPPPPQSIRRCTTPELQAGGRRSPSEAWTRHCVPTEKTPQVQEERHSQRLPVPAAPGPIPLDSGCPGRKSHHAAGSRGMTPGWRSERAPGNGSEACQHRGPR